MDKSWSFPYKGESHKLLSNLVKSPREILATERVAKTFECPPWLPGPNWSKDKTRHCHFHKDYGHETIKCQELKHQIEEYVKTGQLTHLVKGVTKKIEKTSDTQLKKRPANDNEMKEIMFPPIPNEGSSDPVVIKISLSRLKHSPYGLFTRRVVAVRRSTVRSHNRRRTAMQEMGIVVSTLHGAIKFHMPNGVGTIFSDQNSQREETFSTEHQLNVFNHTKPIKQKKRSLAAERNKVVRTQVEELVEAGVLPEVKYQTWVSTPIIMKRDDGKWKLLIDFTNINKACIREPRPLPAAKLGAENLHKYRLKCFLNAYKGYHQIPMAEKDEEKTAFFTREGVFCYRRLPFGLRLIDKVFGSQIGRNMEVNANDMVIKSDSEEEMLADIEETLGILQAINLKLNPRKCSFGVEKGIYSGHLITKQGIRADPSKVKAISALQPPKTVSELQSFGKKLAALNRFRSKSAEKALPFMKTLKSCTSGKMDETLTVYLAASKRNVSAVLMAERGKKQSPAYLNSIKGHILADFLIETSPTEREEEKNGEAKRKEPELENTWKLFTDGASSSDGSGAGLMLVNPEGKEYTYALRFEFKTTTNKVEYEALIAGLRIAKEMQIQELAIFVDSQLVANQVKGLFEAKQQTIKQYLEKTMGLLLSFPSYSIEHIKREQNKKEDALDKLASMTFSNLVKEVLVEVIQTKSVTEKEITDVVKEDEDSWMDDRREAILKVVHVTMVEVRRTNACQDHHKGSARRVLPRIIISDNGKQFVEGTFPVFCKKLETLQEFTSVYHPQANGQVEVTTREIVKGMERRLGMAHQAWVDELPQVLWAHRTTPKSSNGETHFSLV
ncbi:reverse transcriptase domain-containing protein [Tanacetum coccineum]